MKFQFIKKFGPALATLIAACTLNACYFDSNDCLLVCGDPICHDEWVPDTYCQNIQDMLVDEWGNFLGWGDYTTECYENPIHGSWSTICEDNCWCDTLPECTDNFDCASGVCYNGYCA